MQTVLGTNCTIFRKKKLKYFFEGLKSIKLLNDLTIYTKSKTIILTFPQDYQCHVGHFIFCSSVVQPHIALRPVVNPWLFTIIHLLNIHNLS